MKAPQRQKLLDAVYTRDGGRCVYCGIAVRRPGKGVKRASDLATLDHIIPRSVGGPLNQGNLALACQACNNERGVMDSVTFRALKISGRLNT